MQATIELAQEILTLNAQLLDAPRVARPKMAARLTALEAQLDTEIDAGWLAVPSPEDLAQGLLQQLETHCAVCYQAVARSVEKLEPIGYSPRWLGQEITSLLSFPHQSCAAFDQALPRAA